MEFEQVLQILILLVVVLLFWWSHRSFPPQQTAQLIQQLTEASAKTQTQLDDVLVKVAHLLLTQIQNSSPPTDIVSGDKGGELSEV